jgi:hypothetical protein
VHICTGTPSSYSGNGLNSTLVPELKTMNCTYVHELVRRILEMKYVHTFMVPELKTLNCVHELVRRILEMDYT